MRYRDRAMSTYYPGVLTNPGTYYPGVLTNPGNYYPGVLTNPGTNPGTRVNPSSCLPNTAKFLGPRVARFERFHYNNSRYCLSITTIEGTK